MANDSAAAANHPLKPVWLRLTVNGKTWPAWTSLDGQTWADCASQFVQALGWWVALAVTSHVPGQYITATYDSVSGFSPSTVVQIGAA